MFTDESFMVFAGVLDEGAANTRFDRMLSLVSVVPYAKQPVVNRDDGNIVLLATRASMSSNSRGCSGSNGVGDLFPRHAIADMPRVHNRIAERG